MLVYLHCIMPSVIEPSRLCLNYYSSHIRIPGAGGERKEREQHNQHSPDPAEISVIYNETDYGRDRACEHKTLFIIASDT